MPGERTWRCGHCGFVSTNAGGLVNHIRWRHSDPSDRDSQTHNPGVDDHTMERFKRIAGDGRLDDRCRRILAAMRHLWWEDPADLKAEPEPEPERYDPDVWWEAS